MSSNKDSVTNNSPEHWTGRVKWFNNKAGYGFITITDGFRLDTDIFVHHSIINVENQQYKYLVQGEYVVFDMVRTESGNHEWQALNVSGIRGGKLMCETRREFKIAKNEYKTSKGDQTTPNNVHHPRQREPQQREPQQREPRNVTDNNETRQPRQLQPRQRTNTSRIRNEGPRESDSKEWTLSTNKKNRPISQSK
jgi:hypothetical protein